MKKTINTTKIFIIFVFITLMLGLNSCGLKGEKYLPTFDELDLYIPKLLMKDDVLSLPSKLNGYKITWMVDKKDIINDEGQIIKSENFDSELNLTIFIEGLEMGVKTIKISRDMDEYFSLVEEYVRSSIKSRVNSNLRLRLDYYGSDEVVITYTSSHPEYINHDGTFIKHEYDQEVEITVNVESRGKHHSFIIKVLAIGIPDEQKVLKVETWLADYLSTTPLTDEMELPTKHPEYGGTINWICEDPFVILNNKDLYLPNKSGSYTFLTEIIFYSAIKQRQYQVELAAGPNISKLEQATRFIQSTFPISFETLVLYDGRKPEVTKNIIEGDLVKHKLHSGDKPELSQTILNERMYEGYQMPNLDNVLWIVVHETGSRIGGHDATIFDKLQRNRAFNDSLPDARASWHYTVDDRAIIQNYQDKIACWHAGDLSQLGGGNMNGIGIEMCINPDGKYFVAMRNNARLIASLMLKYNLNMLNIKQHRDFMVKDCPETMIRERLWFMFLDLIAKEYVSQALLSDFTISYQIDTLAGMEKWFLDGVYQLTEKFSETKEVNINVLIEDYSFNLKTKTIVK